MRRSTVRPGAIASPSPSPHVGRERAACSTAAPPRPSTPARRSRAPRPACHSAVVVLVVGRGQRRPWSAERGGRLVADLRRQRARGRRHPRQRDRDGEHERRRHRREASQRAAEGLGREVVGEREEGLCEAVMVGRGDVHEPEEPAARLPGMQGNQSAFRRARPRTCPASDQPRIVASVRSRPSVSASAAPSPAPRGPARGRRRCGAPPPGARGACSSANGSPVAELPQDGCELRHGRLAPGADVAGPRPRESGGREVGGHDVADVDVVAGLQAVAERQRRAALDELAAEDRHHPALAVRVLARAVDVRVAQGGHREPVQAAVEAAVALGRVLALPVRGHRRGLGVLRRGDRVGVAVDRAAGGGVHDPRARRRGGPPPAR